MWNEDDHFARWVQGVCAIFLVVFAIALGYMVSEGFGSGYGYGTAGETALFLGALYVAVRCGWYAISGKDNINRDDFD